MIFIFPYFSFCSMGTHSVYEMYEVYNNAFKLGGNLNVILDRYIVEQSNRIIIEAVRVI